MVVGQLFVERGVHRVGGDRTHQQGVAIGRGFGHQFGANHAATAAAVVHHHLLAQQLGQFVGEQPRHGIGAAAGREWHHEADRPGWVRLRQTTGAYDSQCNRQGCCATAHGCSPQSVIHQATPDARR